MRNLKRVLSLALALVMVLGMMVITTSAADYTDEESIKYEEAVDVMSGVGLFKGTEAADGTFSFNPTEVLSREEAATVLARLMLGKAADKLIATKQIFTDVAADRWSAKYIEYCYNTGLIDGLGNGTFAPDGEMTGLAFAKLLLCAMGYDADAQGYVGKDWSVNISVDALYAGLIVDDVLLTAPLTRELAAQMILQALEADMVKYDTYYDYATGAPVVAGPFDVTNKDAAAKTYNNDKDGITQFVEKYFPSLKKTGAADDFWGRPAEYSWKNNNKTLYTKWYAPVATYTEAVTECDIAEELGLEDVTAIVDLTVNAVNVTKEAQVKKLFNGDTAISPLATKATIGEQGRLTEIYETAKGYEVVMIDTFLAEVTEVTEAEYDRNGHVDEQATVTFTVFTKEGATECTWTDDEDFDFVEGEMLLVYAEGDSYDAKNVVDVVTVLGTPDSIVGGQTAYTTKASHIVEDEEYPDAFQLNLDEAGNSVADHVWYFDTYGNIIGAADYVVFTASTYGVISSIYWKDSYDGEDGYAKATITYMDGSDESVTIFSIDTVELEGVEGKKAALTDKVAKVSSTKKYNETEFVNTGLYKITEDAKGRGLVLTSQKALAADTTVETGVPALNDALNAGKSTQFLVWNAKAKDYETYTGIKNVPTYDVEADGWYVDAKKDGVADYIFLNNVKTSKDTDTSSVLYYWNGYMEVTYNLDDETEAVESYTIDGGYVNNEAGEITVATEKLLNTIKGREGKLLVLTLTDGVVTKVTTVKDEAVEIKIDGTKYYAVYAGAVDNDTTAAFDDVTLVDEVLTVANGDVYYTEDLVNEYTYKFDLAKTLKKDDNAYLYVVYTVGKTGFKNADTIYITDVKGANVNAGKVPSANEMTLQAMMFMEGGDKDRLAADIYNIYFTESFVVELCDANGDVIGTLTSKLDTNTAYEKLTAPFRMYEYNSSSWDQDWTPKAAEVPTTYNVVIDGEYVASGIVASGYINVDSGIVDPMTAAAWAAIVG